MQLEPIVRDWNVFIALDYEFQHTQTLKDQPTKQTMTLFQRLVGDLKTIGLYRTLILRAMIPFQFMQTGYCIHGRPGTGKSIMVNMITNLVSKDGVVSLTLYDLLNPFSRHDLVNATMLVVNEVNQIDSKGAAMLQSLLGRDEISHSVKNVQGVFNFRFKGTVIILTNKYPSEVFKHHPALLDRFVMLTHAPRIGDADPKIPTLLNKDLRGIANWALATPRKDLTRLVRGTDRSTIEQQYSLLEKFVCEKLCYCRGENTSQAALHLAILAYNKEFSFEVDEIKEAKLVQNIVQAIKTITRCRDVSEGRNLMTMDDGVRKKTVCLRNAVLDTSALAKEKNLSRFGGAEPQPTSKNNPTLDTVVDEGTQSPFETNPFQFDDLHPAKTLAQEWVQEISLNDQEIYSS